MTGAVRVLVADAHLPTRTGLRLLLERNGFEVVAEAADTSAALRAALRERPALSLIDARLRGGGIAVAGRICSRVPQTEVVVLTDTADEHELLEAVQAGASGYLEKTMAPDTLARALRGVMNGESAFPRAMLGPVLEEFRSRNQRRRLKLPARPAIELSRRESEVLDLLRRGLSTAEIADRLDISPVTVRRHIGLLLKKLNVATRAAALKLIERSGG